MRGDCVEYFDGIAVSTLNLACDRYGQRDVLVAEFAGNRDVTLLSCPICLPIVNAPA